jgi:hypothetical protein
VSALFVELLCFDSSPSPINHTWLVLLLPLLDFVVYNLPVRASTVLGESPIFEFLFILGFAEHLLVWVSLQSYEFGTYPLWNPRFSFKYRITSDKLLSSSTYNL